MPKEKPVTEEQRKAGAAWLRKLESYLESQKPAFVPPKEMDRRQKAIQYDLKHMAVYLGMSPEDRQTMFYNLGYFET